MPPFPAQFGPGGTQTNSTQLVNQLQQTYGSAQFQNLQTIKRQFYSFVPYSATTAPGILTFFGQALGNSGPSGNQQFTNMPKAGSFGQRDFVLCAISVGFYLNSYGLLSFTGTNASAWASDIMAGFPQVGYFSLTIGEKQRVELPRPFLYLETGDGLPVVKTAGITSLTLNTGTPDTLNSITTAPPWAEIACFKTPTSNAYSVNPFVMIEAEQNFQASISFPSNPVPVIAQSIVNDSTNPLYVGLVFDGVEIRPVQ
jgi:hypothetical protein